MKTRLLIFFLFVSVFANAQDTIPNFDFEFWQHGYPTGSCGPTYCTTCPDNWLIFCGRHNEWGMQIDTNAYHGKHALKGVNWTTTNGYVLQATLRQKFAVYSHPAALSCYVKADDSTSSISIWIILYNNSTPVDTGKWNGTNLANNYTKIVIPITQNSSLIDSAYISIAGNANGGHYFLVDYLQLDSVLNSETKIENQTFEFYPNPTTGTFTIKGIDQQRIVNTQIEVYNVYGEKKFQSTNLQTSKSTIDLNSQPDGVYFLKIKTSEGVVTKKLVINK